MLETMSQVHIRLLSWRLANLLYWIMWQPINITDKEIVEMVLFPVVNEACRVLDEGVVVRASDLDTASVLGMSFPSYRWVHVQFSSFCPCLVALPRVILLNRFPGGEYRLEGCHPWLLPKIFLFSTEPLIALYYFISILFSSLSAITSF